MFDYALKLARELDVALDPGEYGPTPQERLENAGFRAFRLSFNFFDQFCPDADAENLEKRFRLETTRRSLYDAVARLAREQGKPLVYDDAFHANLVHQRDLRNGVPLNKLEDLYGPIEGNVRRALTPCDAAYRAAKWNDAEGIRHQADVAFASKRTAVAEEAKATFEIHEEFESEDQLHDIASELAYKVLGPHGFVKSHFFGPSRFPVFVRHFPDELSISWMDTRKDPDRDLLAFAIKNKRELNLQAQPMWLLWQGKLPAVFKITDFGKGYGATVAPELSSYAFFRDLTEYRHVLHAHLTVFEYVIEAAKRAFEKQ